MISLEHPRSRVLASVPGTQQAAEAVLLAQVPQIARVNKKDLAAPEVTYQGEPEYEAIQGTQLATCEKHRQRDHQGRGCVLHVLSGSLVYGQHSERTMDHRQLRFPMTYTRFPRALRHIVSPT